MKSTAQLSLLLSINIMLMACGGSYSVATQNSPDDTSRHLASPDSKSALTAAIKNSLLSQYTQLSSGDTTYYTTSASSQPRYSPPPYQAASYSGTNLQQPGVDEADRIKTDGEYIYLANLSQTGIHIHRANGNRAPLLSQQTLPLTGNNQINGLYLNAETNQLIALGAASQHVYPLGAAWFNTNFWHQRHTDVVQLDISNPAEPLKTSHLTLDGQLIDSRRIGNILYIATRYTPDLEGLINDPIKRSEIHHNRDIIKQASLNDLLPGYTLNQRKNQPLFQADDCLLTGYENKTYHQNAIISLLAIDISTDPLILQGKCFVGNTETLYAANSAIYLATTATPYATTGNSARNRHPMTTDIHKFTLTGGHIDYKGSGTVNGHLGWQQGLKSRRMSEYQDTLRVITFSPDAVDATTSAVRLYTLQENTETQSLEILATLPNNNHPEPLGKKGEKLYAVRFIGPQAYLVTFRSIDPLYRIDLSDPANPFLTGELEITGYSDYLHPIGENYLLGIGKDAVPDAGVGDGRGAWEQGVKLSLIDISNPAAPVEQQQLVLGKRGTDTAVAYSPHALSTLRSGQFLRLAFPVSRHETPDPRDLEYAGNPAYYYQWTRDELVRLQINMETGRIETLPAIVSATAPAPDTAMTLYGTWRYDRSLFIGDSVYYLHGDQLEAAEWPPAK